MSRVVIIGAGALGSHLVLFARNWPETLRVVDFDRVETKNIRSQFHTQMGQGRNKVQALQQAMQGMFRVKLDIVPHMLTEDNREQIIPVEGTRLVIDCTDNIKARTLIQEYCMEQGLRCLHGCLSADGTYAQAVWTEDFDPDPEGEPGQATCEDGDHVAFYAVAGARIAILARRFLDTGKKDMAQMGEGHFKII